MKKYLLLLSLIFYTSLVTAQNDSIPIIKTESLEIVDVVGVYKEHVGFRGKKHTYTSELKGKIITYDENSGTLTFKDQEGKIYSLKNDEYEYFQYDKEFIKKSKKTKNKALKPRKEKGFVFNIGLSFSYLSIPQDLTPDDYFLNSGSNYGDIPTSLKIGVGQYLNKENFIGLTAELGLLMQNKRYLNGGIRFQHMYNTEKNSAFYFPVEAKYSNTEFDVRYGVNDTLFVNNSSQYPADLNTEVSLSAVELNIGQGISFAMKNKKSVSLEIMLVKQFVLDQKFSNIEDNSPNTQFTINGVKMAAFVNF